VSDAIQPADLPLHLKVPPGTTSAEELEMRLEAPLAVQSQTVSGLFPINKFSAVPLMIKAARTASFDSQAGMPSPDDVKKRFDADPSLSRDPPRNGCSSRNRTCNRSANDAR